MKNCAPLKAVGGACYNDELCTCDPETGKFDLHAQYTLSTHTTATATATATSITIATIPGVLGSRAASKPTNALPHPREREKTIVFACQLYADMSAKTQLK